MAGEREVAAGHQEVGVIIQRRDAVIRGSSTRSEPLRHCAVGETRQLLLVALCVEALEGAPVHHGFAAHFEGGHAESTRSGRDGWCARFR